MSAKNKELKPHLPANQYEGESLSLKRTNATRFINAYNGIDYSLRTILNQKRSLSFSDAVRKAATTNAIVKKFEDKLVDYGRLRNAIVHGVGNNIEIVIAEPHDDVTQEIERIAELISTPPLAINFTRTKIIGVDYDVKLHEVLKILHTTGYKNLPVYKDEAIVGVANLMRIAIEIARNVDEGKSIDKMIRDELVGDVVKQNGEVVFYEIRSEQLTIEEALRLFGTNRHLVAILITRRGSNLEKPIGIITAANIAILNKVIEEYQI